MDNLTIYNAVREVPQTAKKSINAGRLKGMTDISPMWRIKCMTEQFGPVGLGWYYEIAEKWLECGAGGEVAAFVRILMYVKYDGEWSKPIEGVGGSLFIASEKSGLHTSDECYKMALTDAISVACKALGVGADVYWEADTTKYNIPQNDSQPIYQRQTPEPAQKEQPAEYVCCDCGKPFTGFTDKNGKAWNAGQVYHMAQSNNTDGQARCRDCSVKAGTRKERTNG